MEQIVVIETDYGAQIYHNLEIPLVYIDLRRWADETPTRPELEKIKLKAADITHPNAYRFMQDWIKENEEYLEDIERPNELPNEKEIQEAKELLKGYGYTVIIRGPEDR